MDRLMDFLSSNKVSDIIILSGAGVSTNAGLPLYKSNMKEFSGDSDAFRKLVYEEIASKADEADPCRAHLLAAELNKRGLLRRVFTQNIDGLYQKAGLSDEMIVEFHGSIQQKNVVPFGGTIPYENIRKVSIDFNDEVGMVIVMGTSLQVAPFCALPNIVRCPRVLVDIDPSRAMVNPYTPVKRVYNDYFDDYQSGMRQDTSVTFPKISTTIPKRCVTLRPTWKDNKRFPDTFIVKMDADKFSLEIISHFK